MEKEIKNCQNCKQNFVIEPEDFDFYEKIKVSAPTFCSDCRAIRRCVFYNQINLYKKTPASAEGFGEAKEFKDGKKIFSAFPEEANIKIYDHDYWWSDKWDPMDYMRDIDFSVPFLSQLKELNFLVPWPSRSVRGMVNSDYCNNTSYIKNSYLCFNGNNNENCQYCVGSNYAKDSVDCCLSLKPELCYETFECNNIFQCFYCSDVKDSQNLWFCEECVNCKDCFGCFNLRNKQYHIWNKPYSKEEYLKELSKITFGSFSEIKKIKEKFFEFKLTLPVKYMHGNHNNIVSGEYIYRAKNTHNCFEVYGCENTKYSQQLADTTKDSYDFTNWSQNSELVYESCCCGDNCKNIKFCFDCWPAMQDCEYCITCHSCSDCFGCVGLRSKQYCILNKQYTKEEYKALVPKIIEHMNNMSYIDENGLVYKYGEFFPIEFSPLAYNETIALDYFPKTKEQAITEGYLWRDRTQGDYKITVDAVNLPDNIKDVQDDIIKEVIKCESCKNAYKIIDSELRFYKKFLIPLPHFCFNCRYLERRAKANPLKLWHRKCMKAGCNNEFETSYAPDRKEIVYCENCYQQEIY
ncbi:MAG: hypothetical protein WCK10_01095 [Candidatus Staskawiczbacteria bacterium]